MTHFFLVLSNIAQCVYSPTEGNLSCLLFLAVMKKATICKFLGKYQGDKVLDHMKECMLVS